MYYPDTACGDFLSSPCSLPDNPARYRCKHDFARCSPVKKLSGGIHIAPVNTICCMPDEEETTIYCATRDKVDTPEKLSRCRGEFSRVFFFDCADQRFSKILVSFSIGFDGGIHFFPLIIVKSHFVVEEINDKARRHIFSR